MGDGSALGMMSDARRRGSVGGGGLFETFGNDCVAIGPRGNGTTGVWGSDDELALAFDADAFAGVDLAAADFRVRLVRVLATSSSSSLSSSSSSL